MANVNGTDINLMPTEGMRAEAERYRELEKRRRGRWYRCLGQEQELHKY